MWKNGRSSLEIVMFTPACPNAPEPEKAVDGQCPFAADRTQSMYWSGVTTKSSGSFTPVAWFGQ
jgi:hypothetical protein